MSEFHPTAPTALQPGDGGVALPATLANYSPLTPLSFLERGPKVLLVDRDSTSTVQLALEGLAKDLHGQDPEICLTPMGE